MFQYQVKEAMRARVNRYAKNILMTLMLNLNEFKLVEYLVPMINASLDWLCFIITNFVGIVTQYK